MSAAQIIFMVGPTSVGKTSIAVDLAQRINGEIVSCDAVQVYKEISITGNKPPAALLKKILHHMIGVVSVEEEFDVASFRREAVSVLNNILLRKKNPVVVGGSGLYMSVLLDGIFEGGDKDENLRKEFQEDAAKRGVEFLYQKLLKIDPAAALKIHPNDVRRVIRALEVFATQQRMISSLQKQRRGLWEEYDVRIYALNRLREELYERINRRVDEMFEEGLVDEIRKLNTLRLSQTVRKVIGLREVNGFINGEHSLARAAYLMKLNTRHYAKRQLTWFRKDKRLTWILTDKQESDLDVVTKIMKDLLTRGG